MLALRYRFASSEISKIQASLAISFVSLGSPDRDSSIVLPIQFSYKWRLCYCLDVLNYETLDVVVGKQQISFASASRYVSLLNVLIALSEDKSVSA